MSPKPLSSLEVGDNVDAQESNIWYKAKVLSVSQNGFKIHYQGWNKKWDKIFPFDTDQVQIMKDEADNKYTKAKFALNQKVMAPFSDSNKYPAEVVAVHESNKTYRVKFYDGLIKNNVSERDLDRFTEKAKREAEILADELYGGPVDNKIVGNIPDVSGKRVRKSIGPNSGVSTPESKSRSRSSSKNTTPKGSRANTPVREKSISAKTPVRSRRSQVPAEVEKPKVKKEHVSPKKEAVSEEKRTPKSTKKEVEKETGTPKAVKKDPIKNVTPRIASKRIRKSLLKESDKIVDDREFEFSDSPAEPIRLNSEDQIPELVDVSSPGKKSTRKGNKTDMAHLLGAEGLNKTIEVCWNEQWISAKIVPSPYNKENAAFEKTHIYVHFNGWSKSFDQWFPLNDKIIRLFTKTITYDFKIGDKIMGKWSDNDYYPCTVLKQQNSGYLVEFYDGLTKQIRAIQTKKMSKEDEQKALKIAEDKFSPSNNLPKGRKSVYKREKPTTPTQNDTTPEPIEEPKPKRIKLDVENKKRRHNGRFAKAVPEPFELENAKDQKLAVTPKSAKSDSKPSKLENTKLDAKQPETPKSSKTDPKPSKLDNTKLVTTEIKQLETKNVPKATIVKTNGNGETPTRSSRRSTRRNSDATMEIPVIEQEVLKPILEQEKPVQSPKIKKKIAPPKTPKSPKQTPKNLRKTSVPVEESKILDTPTPQVETPKTPTQKPEKSKVSENPVEKPKVSEKPVEKPEVSEKPKVSEKPVEKPNVSEKRSTRRNSEAKMETPVIQQKVLKQISEKEKPAQIAKIEKDPVSTQAEEPEKISEKESEKIRLEKEEMEILKKAQEIAEMQQKIAARKQKIAERKLKLEKELETERQEKAKQEKKETEFDLSGIPEDDVKLINGMIGLGNFKRDEIQKSIDTIRARNLDSNPVETKTTKKLTGPVQPELEVVVIPEDVIIPEIVDIPKEPVSTEVTLVLPEVLPVPEEVIIPEVVPVVLPEVVKISEVVPVVLPVPEVVKMPEMVPVVSPVPEVVKMPEVVPVPEVVKNPEIVPVPKQKLVISESDVFEEEPVKLKETPKPKVEKVQPIEEKKKEIREVSRTRRTSNLKSSPRSSPRQSGIQKRQLSTTIAPSSPASSSDMSESRSTRLRYRSQTRDDEDSDINSNSKKYEIGDLVWAKWKDRKPYGAIILNISETGYVIRYADGVEMAINEDRIEDDWKPELALDEDFLAFYQNLFKKSDEKIIQKRLNAAKLSFEKAELESKNGKSVFREAAPQTSSGGTAIEQKTEPKEQTGNKPLPVAKKQVIQRKSISSMAEKLSEKANLTPRVEKVEVLTPPVESRSEGRTRSRKGQPMRRKSETGNESKSETGNDSKTEAGNDSKTELKPEEPVAKPVIKSVVKPLEKISSPKPVLSPKTSFSPKPVVSAKPALTPKVVLSPKAISSQKAVLSPRQVKSPKSVTIKSPKQNRAQTPEKKLSPRRTRRLTMESQNSDAEKKGAKEQSSKVEKSAKEQNSKVETGAKETNPKVEKDAKEPSSKVGKSAKEQSSKVAKSPARIVEKIPEPDQPPAKITKTGRSVGRPKLTSPTAKKLESPKVAKEHNSKILSSPVKMMPKSVKELVIAKTESEVDAKMTPTRMSTRPSTSIFAYSSVRSPIIGRSPIRTADFEPKKDVESLDIIRTRRTSHVKSSPTSVSSGELFEPELRKEMESESVLDIITSDKETPPYPAGTPPKRSSKRRLSRSSQSSTQSEDMSVAKSANYSTEIAEMMKKVETNQPKVHLVRTPRPKAVGPPTSPKFKPSDHVIIRESGRFASIINPHAFRNGGWEYFIRCEGGPKIREVENNIEMMPVANVVSPILEDLIDKTMKKVTKNHAERRKSEASGAGWAYELKPQAFKAKKAFEGANKEFRCPLDSCDKSFRKSNGLDAHMRHYHPDYHEEESSFSPQTINLQSTNSSFLSDSAIPSTREHSSASEEETSPTIYQCSCGWEGESFWGETPGGIPVRNHICQRPRAARNLKNTHLLKEFGRTVDHADYFDGFKRSLYKDEATQELVREVNLVQNEVLETVKTADLARLDCEYLPNNNYEKFKIGSERKIDEEVTFSMVEGVSGAQNAMPFTQNNENKFSKRELALLKEVDARDSNLIETIHKQSEIDNKQDELEDYITFMERDLEHKAVLVNENMMTL